jgi:hypothetical protein
LHAVQVVGNALQGVIAHVLEETPCRDACQLLNLAGVGFLQALDFLEMVAKLHVRFLCCQQAMRAALRLCRNRFRQAQPEDFDRLNPRVPAT